MVGGGSDKSSRCDDASRYWRGVRRVVVGVFVGLFVRMGVVGLLSNVNVGRQTQILGSFIRVVDDERVVGSNSCGIDQDPSKNELHLHQSHLDARRCRAGAGGGHLSFKI